VRKLSAHHARLQRALVLTMTQSPTMDSKETETKLLLTPKKTNEIKDNKPCILAIFSSQIFAMMERSDAILKHETTNRRCEICPRDIRFQSSLFTIHTVTKSGLMNRNTRIAAHHLTVTVKVFKVKNKLLSVVAEIKL